MKDEGILCPWAGGNDYGHRKQGGTEQRSGENLHCSCGADMETAGGKLGKDGVSGSDFERGRA